MGYGTIMDGVSFIARVRNEEETLEASLRSLKGLTIPHEIVVILHLCTDRSKQIAETLQAEGFPIRIKEYNIKTSRAGYETMATDALSEHSLVTYYNFGISDVKYVWNVKWDADYVTTPEFLEYFNSKTWPKPEHSTKISFDSKSEDGTNTEPFLFSGNFHYTKYFFWEILSAKDHVVASHANVYVNTLSKLSNVKSYWKEPAWFFDDSDEAKIVLDRYITITRVCGNEPVGCARALNPECNNPFWYVQQHLKILEEFGIRAI
jgi:glycosyltransferase involved in cell wall biosynthesis